MTDYQVLVMGLLGSLSSIFYVALLLMLVFYLYGIMCVSFFSENDPVHFGQLEVAFLTLFRMATFEDWTDVLYTELYGCDIYPYAFRQHWCTSPERAMGWVAAPFFISFIVLSSLVVLNLFIGVIISNMNEARATLTKVSAKAIILENSSLNHFAWTQGLSIMALNILYYAHVGPVWAMSLGSTVADDRDEDEFQQDASILRSMLKRMDDLSGTLAEARDSMMDMQSEVSKLESSAR
eukprot:scaffold185992_cov44-Prasinocladus_malaysianus.AAC.2